MHKRKHMHTCTYVKKKFCCIQTSDYLTDLVNFKCDKNPMIILISMKITKIKSLHIQNLCEHVLRTHFNPP